MFETLVDQAIARSKGYDPSEYVQDMLSLASTHDLCRVTAAAIIVSRHDVERHDIVAAFGEGDFVECERWDDFCAEAYRALTGQLSPAVLIASLIAHEEARRNVVEYEPSSPQHILMGYTIDDFASHLAYAVQLATSGLRRACQKHSTQTVAAILRESAYRGFNVHDAESIVQVIADGQNGRGTDFVQMIPKLVGTVKGANRNGQNPFDGMSATEVGKVLGGFVIDTGECDLVRMSMLMMFALSRASAPDL